MLADDLIALGARDAIAALNIPFLVVRADYGVPTRDSTVPFCDVFVGMDEAQPRNDPRTSWSHYQHAITLAIELTANGNSQRDAKAWLAVAGEAILDALLGDREWAKRDGRSIIEGFGALRRGYVAPAEGERHTVKLQIELKVLIASQFARSADLLPLLTTLSTTLDVGGDQSFGATLAVPND